MDHIKLKNHTQALILLICVSILAFQAKILILNTNKFLKKTNCDMT